jgi:hypothetical protein
VPLVEDMDPRSRKRGRGDLVTAMFIAVNSYWKTHKALLRLATYHAGNCIECAHKHPNHCHRCGLGAALGCLPHKPLPREHG